MSFDVREGDAPLCVELYCGTFGWSQGWLDRGGAAIGFDTEHMPHHGEVPERASLVLQDVRALHGSQFKDAALILASPPCQEFSYRAMPWKRAREMPPPVLGMELFEACFRIQREASEAAGRHVPMIVENVRGAQKWVGRAAWHFGSFYLWGDVPALMPRPYRATKVPAFRFDGSGRSFQSASVEGTKVGGLDWNDRTRKGQAFNTHAEKRVLDEGIKIGDRNVARATGGHQWSPHWTSRSEGVKGFTPNGEPLGKNALGRKHGSKSPARKAASALIARIPERLSDWIAEVYYPSEYAEMPLSHGPGSAPTPGNATTKEDETT